MFAQSMILPTSTNVIASSSVGISSHLALNSKLNEVISSFNNDRDEKGEDVALSNMTPHGASFLQVMSSLNAPSKNEESLSQQKTLSQFSTMLNGDYLSSFKIENPTPADKLAEPKGMAARGGFKEYSPEREVRAIDKTSVLYEKALELESYFVKIMMESMRATLSGQTLIGEESFASKMYKDMMYDELNRTVTKNAGFGLADHIYLQLDRGESSN